MSRGQRCLSRAPFTGEEIEILRKAIRSIGADESVFVFNDPNHMGGSTCYNYQDDVVYVTRNVFPNEDSLSTHPRDRLTPRAVLAHEYYGHRAARQRYLDEESGIVEKEPLWRDEAYASINAAFNTPGLTQVERAELIYDAVKRAEEYSQIIVPTAEMKEVLYGKWEYCPERNIVDIEEYVVFAPFPGGERDGEDRDGDRPLPGMR